MDTATREPLARLSASPGAFPIGGALLALGMLGGLAVVLLGLDHLPITVCYFKALSGFPCMSCGGTRAVAALARLDPAAALASNPLAALAGLALVPWGLSDLLLWPRGRALRLSVAAPLQPGLRLTVLVAVALNWAYLIAAGR